MPVNFATLRSLQRAVYSPTEEGHYALASECYCHFTSPIRRYPDLTVHRLVDALLVGPKPRNDMDELMILAQHCSDREQRAEAAERELTKLKLLAYMSTRIGEEMEAIVTGVESFGLFTQGVKLPAEGLIHIDSLADDYYDFDRAAHTLSGRRAGNTFRLGDLVKVVVARRRSRTPSTGFSPCLEAKNRGGGKADKETERRRPSQQTQPTQTAALTAGDGRGPQACGPERKKQPRLAD